MIPTSNYDKYFRQYIGTITPRWNGNLVSAYLYFETNSIGGVYPDYIVDDVMLTIPEEDPGNFIAGTGWKDIKTPILIGGAVTEGEKNYFTNLKAKNQVLHDCHAVQVQCYPAWGRWDESEPYVYQIDAFSSQMREMKEQNMIASAHMLFGGDKY